MRPLLTPLAILVAFAAYASAAAPPPVMRSADQLDYLFLGSDRPVLLRLHVRVGDKAYDSRWNEFMDKMFDWFDKDKDGSLSPAEVARLPIPSAISTIVQGNFGAYNQTVPLATIDTNKDGRVSRGEFRAYYRASGFSAVAFTSQTAQAEQAKQINAAILKRLDRKGDGKLTAVKVADFYEKLRTLDENEDEILTRAELDAKGGDGNPYGVAFAYNGVMPRVVNGTGLQQVEPGREERLIKALVAKYDRDKDGKLSRKEIGLNGAAFSRFDADKDGFLDHAELMAYLTTARPDLELRLQLGAPAGGEPLLSRFGLAALLPTGPRVVLVNDKTIDPEMKKRYRRGTGDGCAMELGDTRLSLRTTPMQNGVLRVNNLRAYYLQLHGQAAGKKDHVTRADLKDPNYQILLSIFSQADKNADDKLTRLEINAWLDFLATASDIALTLTCDDLGRGLFEILDADGDGRLSLREMRSAWKRLGPLAKDGALGPNDVPHTMRLDIRMGGGQSFGPVPLAFVMGAAPPRAATRAGAPVWFRKMDKNGDGDISQREWLGTVEEFRAIDADGDGLISADEAIAFDKKKRAKE